ncbi:ATP-dependent helicase HrpB [Aliidiomarina iranensis]|uniref:ATP-dependent helicase HrpB n=1 Tax=Aliidiomarina iranensis TaxID=1434071 RepID=A0A432VV18_9GAMM|nr:ATP-dependent helicase HrpB [Aliidiomarina iranensis]RUO20376.1 ATP-dependent helicase HrpB [Aliidiomarina iranensis]
MANKNLPVAALLPELQEALAEHIVVLEAPPGAGKSTVIPLALITSAAFLSERSNQQIILVQPRRVAAVSIAHFLAQQLEEKVGERVGYWVRGERKKSAKTRLLVVTDGMLTRIIQHNPELTDTALIIFDEFHERNLHCDFGLALALEARELNESLQLLVMSATLPAEALAKWLRSRDLPVAILSSGGRQYPITLHYRPPARNTSWQQALPAVVHEALASAEQGVLVFLPGQGEIRELKNNVRLPPDVECFELYGGLSLSAQQQALLPLKFGSRKLVLATNIAETSLTIPDIDVVVDSGRERQAKYLPKYQFTQLQTRYISQASAVQRAGRAGRTGPGQCFRLWPESMNQGFAAYSKPALETEDLRPIVLEAAAWGSSPIELAWFTPPPAAALAAANEWLLAANLLVKPVSQEASIETAQEPKIPRLSGLGQKIQALSTDVEIALLLTAAKDTRVEQFLLAIQSNKDLDEVAKARQQLQYEMKSAAALIAAHQEAHESRAAGDLFEVIQHWLEQPEAFKQSHKRLAHWCQQLKITMPERMPTVRVMAVLMLQAMPMRLAKASEKTPQRYQMATGVAMQLSRSEFPFSSERQWLLVNQVSLQEERAEGVIWQALVIPSTLLDSWVGEFIQPQESWQWLGRQGRLQRVIEYRMGAVVFTQQESTQPVSKAVRLNAMLTVVKSRGVAMFTAEAEPKQLAQWLTRVQIGAEFLGLDVEDWQPEALLATLDEWAGHELQELQTREQALQWNPLPALKQRFAIQTAYRGEAELAEFLPLRWQAPSGRTHPIHYELVPQVHSGDKPQVQSGDKPEVHSGDKLLATARVALKLQEVLGTPASPTLGKGRIMLSFELLSPAGRPLQKTNDLASFWRNGYQQVRKEMRGRYPKHPWPEDPTTAAATHLTKRAFGKTAGENE